MAKKRMIDTLVRGKYKPGPFKACDCDDVDEVIVHTGASIAEHEKCSGLTGSERLKGKWDVVGERRGRGLWRRRK